MNQPIPTPEARQQIAAALGVPTTEEMFETLARRLGEVVSSPVPRAFLESGPYPYKEAPQFRRAHSALKRQAEKVCEVLDDWDWRKDTLQDILSRIEAIAPDEYKGGRPADWRLRAAIYRLGRMYAQWTGRKLGLSRDVDGKPCGPFFRFVSASLRAFAPSLLKGDEALYSAIDRMRNIKVRPTI